MSHFLVFNFFHPIVISEICSFSPKNPGKNLLKFVGRKIILGNFRKNRRVFAEKYYPPSLRLDSESNHSEISNDKIKKKWLEAVEKGNMDHFNFFINNYDDIDFGMKNFRNDTVLLIAFNKENDEIVKILLMKEDVDVNVKSVTGNISILTGASFHGLSEIVKNILDRNDANVNLRNGFGHTALIEASRMGNEKIVEMLLKRNDLDVNLYDYNGSNALIYAVKGGNREIVRLLLTRDDININLTDINDKTVSDIAAEEGHDEISKMLENYIAENV